MEESNKKYTFHSFYNSPNISDEENAQLRYIFGLLLLTHKDEEINCAINIVGNLNLKKSLKRNNPEKYSSAKEYILVPQSPEYYSWKSKKYRSFNSINRHYSYRTVKKVYKKLSKFFMLSRKIGWYRQKIDKNGKITKKSKMTQIFLTDTTTWNFYKFYDLEDALLLHCFFNNFEYFFSNKNKSKSKQKFIEFKKSLSVFTKDKSISFSGNSFIKKRNSNKYHNNGTYLITEAPKQYTDIVDHINSHLPYEILHYKRQFGKNLYTEGRFFSKWQYIPKETREKILHYNKMVELDFDSFNLNLLHMILHNNKKISSEDIYIDILNDIPIWKDADDYTKKHELRKFIKTLVLPVTSTNSKSKLIQSIQNSLYKKNKEYKMKNPLYIDIQSDWVVDSIYKHLDCIKPFLAKEMYKYTQFVESEIIQDIMIEMIKKDIMPLTCHDAIFVPVEYKEYFDKLKEKLLIKYAIKYKDLFFNEKREKKIYPILNQITITRVFPLLYKKSLLFIKGLNKKYKRVNKSLKTSINIYRETNLKYKKKRKRKIKTGFT